ncbi:MAG: hypothetical protein FVQ80_08975 [Planctomycetes bacterium]|nr:hypothetical protein [Planctomycetota bacterium]
MFTIDLMKGQGLPVKTDIKIMTATAIAFSVPCILLFLMVGSFFYSRIVIKTQTHSLKEHQARFEKLKPKVEQGKMQKAEQKKITLCLTETDDVIDKYVQWTQLMMLLSEHLPQEMVIGRLEVKLKTVSKRVPRKDDPDRKINIPVSARTLLINTYSFTNYDSDHAVKQFQQNLLASKWFKDNVQDIVVASRRPENIDREDIIMYELNCNLVVN